MNDVVERRPLGAIAIEINEAGGVMAEKAVQVGRLLLDAREQMPSDTKFGKWRSNKTWVRSKQTAHKLMAIATKFGNNRTLQKLPVSVLQELLCSSDETVREMEERVVRGDPPTHREVHGW